MSWLKKSPEEKAEAFDAQYQHSTDSANAKRERGEYPYDQEVYLTNGAGTNDKPEKRKGKHRK